MKVNGKVTDENTGEPIPFAGIVLKSTRSVIPCDSVGGFRFSASGRPDTLYVSALGYVADTVPLSPMQNQLLRIKLTSSAFNLAEVTVHLGENPAFEILRKVIANKPINDPDEKDAYEYEVYHKVEFDLNNFTDKIKQNIFLRSFNFVFDNTDTTADGVTYLPVLFNESYSDFYYRKNPLVKKEVVHGRRSVGLKGPKIMQFAQDMYLYPNIYNNYVVILDKNFPSPINDNYKSNYKYLLLDSMMIGNSHCFYIRFKPKVKEDIAFTGEMYIDDSTYAVKQIDLRFSINANVNFVRNYWIRQEYDKVDGVNNMITKGQVIGDFTVAENSKELTGFFGKKTSTYRNYKINQPRDDDFYKGLDNIVFDDSAEVRTESYWNDVRQDTLTKQEQGVFTMIDTLEKNRKFVRLKNSVNALTTGWVPFGKIDIGDFYTFYSYNLVEHSRYKMGFRVHDLMNERLNFKTYLAYGVYDERYKYLVESSFVLSRNQSKRNSVGGMIKYDAVQPGRSSNMLPLDFVFTSLFVTNPLKYRSLVKEVSGYFERQWFTGLSSRISVSQSTWQPFGDYNYQERNEYDQTKVVNSYTLSGFDLSLRYAYGERNLSAKFDDRLEGMYFPKYPVVSFDYMKGINGFLQGGFDMDRLRLRVEEKLRTKKLGYSIFRIEGGKTFGTLPFTFLETPIANQMILNDETGYNLMNYLEFVSDEYVSAMWEQHFEGLMFNRIPLIKKLKLREFVFAKMYAGNLSSNNRNSQYVLPEGVTYLNQPYYETGFGIENILKISRIDFSWRLNYPTKPGVYYFIVKPSFQFKF